MQHLAEEDDAAIGPAKRLLRAIGNQTLALLRNAVLLMRGYVPPAVFGAIVDAALTRLQPFGLHPSLIGDRRIGLHPEGRGLGVVTRHADTQIVARRHADPRLGEAVARGKNELVELRFGDPGHAHGDVEPEPGRLPIDLAALEGELRIDRGMQRAEMMLIDRVLGTLQPVAIFLVCADLGEAGFAEEHVPARECRQRLRPEIREDEAAYLEYRVAGELHVPLQAAGFGFERQVDAASIRAVLPAVVAAADAAFLDATEFERDPTVRAVALDEAELARWFPEQDEVFAEEPHRHGLRRHLLAEPDRPPIAAEQRAHPRPRTDARQQFVLGFIHVSSPGGG